MRSTMAAAAMRPAAIRSSPGWPSTTPVIIVRSSSIVERSSAVRLAFRNTKPDWEARSCKSLSSVSVSGSPGGFVSARAPSNSSAWRTGTTRVAPSIGGRASSWEADKRQGVSDRPCLIRCRGACVFADRHEEVEGAPLIDERHPPPREWVVAGLG
jgi:hypothetical protein